MAISEPTINTIANGWEFAFIAGNEEGIIIQVKNFHQERNLNLTAELDTFGLIPDLDLLKSDIGIRYNLNSPTARKNLENNLKQSCLDSSREAIIPWGEIVSDVCRRAIQLYREGAPAVEVWSTDEPEPPQYLIEPVLPLNMPTIIFGDPGSGKSLLGLLFALVAQLPYHDNRLGLKAPKEPSHVLYLDYETTESEFNRNLTALTKGLDLPPTSIHYLSCHLPIPDMVQAVQKNCRELDSRFIVVDSLAYATGGNVNEPEPAIRVFNSIRPLNITPLFLAHTSKDQWAKTKSTYGSVFFTAAGRSIWECKGAQEPEDDTLEVGLFHRKANTSRRYAPLGFRFTFANNKISVVRETLEDTSLSTSLPLSFQIKNLLRPGALMQEEIAEALEKSNDTIRKTLSRMARKEIVQRLSDKKWGLAL